MAKKTKEEKMYILINAILLLISLTLITYIYLLIKDNKKPIITEYSSNAIESTLEIKKNNIETINSTGTTIPTIKADIQNNIQNNEEYNFEEVINNKYYYNQLNDNAKLIYASIENNLNNMKTGTYKIKLANEVANVLKYDNGEEMLNKDFQSAWDALSLDRMDIFFIDVSKISLNIKKTTHLNNVTYSLAIVSEDETGYLKDGLTSKIDVNSILNQIKDNRDSIIRNVTGDKYSKVLQVHDWIIENLEYSLDIQNANTYNLYGALINKSAVCEGYAEAFKYILDELGIPCILVSGTATNSEGITENHAWNYVQIDEKWYAVDTTWDDPIVKGFGYVTNSVKHKYFLQGSKKMNENHTTRGNITETGQEFEYPELEKNEYKK